MPITEDHHMDAQIRPTYFCIMSSYRALLEESRDQSLQQIARQEGRNHLMVLAAVSNY